MSYVNCFDSKSWEGLNVDDIFGVKSWCVIVLNLLHRSLYGINRNRYYTCISIFNIQLRLTPPETKSEATGIRGRELVTALCLSKISFAAISLFTNTHSFHPIWIRYNSPNSLDHSRNFFSGWASGTSNVLPITGRPLGPGTRRKPFGGRRREVDRRERQKRMKSETAIVATNMFAAWRDDSGVEGYKVFALELVVGMRGVRAGIPAYRRRNKASHCPLAEIPMYFNHDAGLLRDVYKRDPDKD